jgi:hypothetical protein
MKDKLRDFFIDAYYTLGFIFFYVLYLILEVLAHGKRR